MYFLIVAISNFFFLLSRAQIIIPEGAYKISAIDRPQNCLHIFGSVPLQTDKVRNYPWMNTVLQNFRLIKVGANYRIARDGLTKYGLTTPNSGIDMRVTEFDAGNPNKSLWIINEKGTTSSDSSLSINKRDFYMRNIGSN